MHTGRQRHPHRPISTSIPPDNDIDTVRCAWAMIVAGDANYPSAACNGMDIRAEGRCTFSGHCPLRKKLVSDIPENHLRDIRHQPQRRTCARQAEKKQNKKREAQQRPLPNPPQGSKSYNKPHLNHLQGQGVPSNRLKHSKKGLPPLGEGWGGALGVPGWGFLVIST